MKTTNHDESPSLAVDECKERLHRAWGSRLTPPLESLGPEFIIQSGVPKQQHIPALDGLRGLAVLFILLFHFHFIFSDRSGTEALIYHSLNFGWCGVNLFFSLSGFLITGILLDTRNSNHFFSTFYARRALRIWPLYYCFLLFVFALNQLHYVSQTMRYIPTNWGWYLFYLQNFVPVQNIRLAHFWSLAVEEQFYLLWPAFVYLLPARRLIPASVIAIILCLGLRCFLVTTGIASAYVFTSMFTRVDELVLGSVVAMIVRDPVLLRQAHKVVWLAVATGSLGLLAVLMGKQLMNGIGLSCIGLLFSSLVFLVARSTGTLARLFSLQKLRSLGKYGYGVYVLHPTLYAATSGPLRHAMDGRSPLLMIIIKLAYLPTMVVLSYVVGKMSWLFLEERFNALKGRFPYED